MARLEVEIAAKTDNLKSQLSKTIKLMDDLKDEQKALKKEFDAGRISADKYYQSLAQNRIKLRQVSTSNRDLGKSLGSVSKGMGQAGKATANAVPAVTEFSRVIQDAPFGIQGVANNITQLTQQFGVLSQKTGGAKGALTAMLGTLKGPAGILLAISVVTSLLVSFGDKLFGASKKSDKLKDSTKETNDELKSQGAILKDLIKDYENFSKIRTQSIFNITKEKESVKALFSILKDELSTISEKQRAYSELEKKYSAYLKNVDPSNINQVLKAEDALNKQLKIREKRIQTLNRLEENSRNIQLKRIEIENLSKKKSTRLSKFKISNLVKEIGKLRELQKELREALSLYTALDTSIGNLGGQRQQATTVSTLSPVGINAQGGESGAGGEARTEAPLLGGFNNILTDEQVEALKERMKQIQLQGNLLAQSLTSSFENITNNIAQNLQNTLGFLGSFLGEFIKLYSQLIQAQIKNLIQQQIVSKKSEAINRATLASQIATDKAKATSSAVVAAANTAKTSPKGAFLLPALIAASLAAVSGAFNKVGGGGGVSGGVAGGGSSGGSSFGGSRSFSGGNQITGNVTFRIEGNDLVGVLRNSLEQNGIFGGNISISG